MNCRMICAVLIRKKFVLFIYFFVVFSLAHLFLQHTFNAQIYGCCTFMNSNILLSYTHFYFTRKFDKHHDTVGPESVCIEYNVYTYVNEVRIVSLNTFCTRNTFFGMKSFVHKSCRGGRAFWKLISIAMRNARAIEKKEWNVNDARENGFWQILLTLYCDSAQKKRVQRSCSRVHIVGDGWEVYKY